MTVFGTVYCFLGVLLVIDALVMGRRNPNLIGNGFALEIGLLLLVDGAYFLTAEEGMSAPFAFLFYAEKAVFAALGVVLLFDGLYTVRREGISLTHVLPIAWGVLLLFVTYWFMWGLGYGASGDEWFIDVTSCLTTLVGYIPFALLGAMLSNAICHRAPRKPETEYVIVLGCAILKDGTVTPLLRGRCDAAIKTWKAGGCRAKIICSGGQGPNEVISEAQSMANYLVSQGVPQSDVLLEDKSTTTEENLRYSHAIIDERGGATRCTIATNSYHCLRAAMFARREGLNAVCVGGRTAAFYYPAAFFREYVALAVRNKYAVAAFFVFAVVKTMLELNGILPQGVL